ncbi:hypothetical protein U0070_006965 [Myodes glareolus]|uniref:Reverse transcriptase domain-containing protein n=1 Tax=Myodes glareolus TaxID=447135 RepID=A0AAW0ICE5_MYOGA
MAYNGRDSAEGKEIKKVQCKNQHLANVLLPLPWNQRSAGGNCDAWRLERRMRNQKRPRKASYHKSGGYWTWVSSGLCIPPLPIKNPHSNDYRPVQVLREVNKRVVDTHPTVLNPYALLSSMASDQQWYTVLDLKDAFSSLPLDPKSQQYFAFERHDPEIWINSQLM